jgi:hypothetical protein
VRLGRMSCVCLRNTAFSTCLCHAVRFVPVMAFFERRPIPAIGSLSATPVGIQLDPEASFSVRGLVCPCLTEIDSVSRCLGQVTLHSSTSKSFGIRLQNLITDGEVTVRSVMSAKLPMFYSTFGFSSDVKCLAMWMRLQGIL